MNFWFKFEKLLLVIFLSILHARPLLKKFLFESVQTFANQLWGLMLANYTLSADVSTLAHRPLYAFGPQSGNNSQLDKTKPVALNVWFSPVFSEQEQIVESRAFI